jgi:hypothetical protein
MVMTEHALLWLGTLAALVSYLGLFNRFQDNWTPVLLIFTGALLWGAFGLSAGDVLIPTGSGSTSAAMLPLFYGGLALALLTFLFGINEFMQAFGSDAADVDADPLR